MGQVQAAKIYKKITKHTSTAEKIASWLFTVGSVGRRGHESRPPGLHQLRDPLPGTGAQREHGLRIRLEVSEI